MAKFLLIGIILNLILSTNCHTFIWGSNTSDVIELSQGLRKFSSNYYKSAMDNSTNNIVISSFSALMVLGMLDNGASGNIKKEFHDSIELPINTNITKTGFQSLIDTLNNIRVESRLWLTNHIFVSSTVQGQHDFIINNMEYFRSEARVIDLSNKTQATLSINEWCSNKTMNMIKDLATPDSIKFAEFIIANAIYFNATWESKFDPARTLIASYLVNDTVKYIPTMQKSGYFLHGTMRKYNGTFIALPYKVKNVNNNKGTLKMYIMMFPNERKLKKFEMNIDKVNFNKINTSYSSMDLALPKFKIESKLDLSSVFSKMGINEMFGYSVYLKDIVNTTSAKIGEVIQKVVIEVDEEGTKVAAITGGFGEVKVESLHVQTIIKPFVITIVSEYYGTVLFSARICDPTIDIFQYHLNNLKKT
ncbi:hypothetical protein HCN44_001391 [Aphidius gifuensis]|uniref:Serpin domain-containing protein n=1 Tax=Aphidius gifuensis TaxID=684658 RepID=A0A834XSL8_APHGI|nr:hypothetical protein HCN44_001391 [Aphidius gifuensis]